MARCSLYTTCGCTEHPRGLRGPNIDEGHSSASPIDQRGVARLDGNHDGTVLPDIGAFEFDDPIFRDGFESGDSSGWSATQPPS